MKKRQKALDDAYEAQWDGGRGSHHPDYDPEAMGEGVVKASRETEELYNALVKNDIKAVYAKLEAGADPNFVFGPAYKCPEGYTPLMVAAHRGRLECARALLRAGADPNYVNGAGDLTLFWGIDGGVEMIKLLQDYGVDLDATSPKGWTPLSYAKAKGKYGATEEKGIYPEVRWTREEGEEETFRSGTGRWEWMHGGGGVFPWGCGALREAASAMLQTCSLLSPAPAAFPTRPHAAIPNPGRAQVLWRDQVRQRAACAGRSLTA